MKIKKTLLRKSIIATLLLVLAFSAMATNILLVQADKGGIGKFVEITIYEGGTVTMIKLSSGETWVTENYLYEKVGAGTVRLTAEPKEGYVFDYWTVEGEQKNIGIPELEFKTVQGVTSVVAVFGRQFWEITAAADGPGTITTEYNGIIYNGTSFTVPVAHDDDSPTFEFTPDDVEDYHISSIKVDNVYINYTTEYTFPDPITSNHEIVVTFNDIGIATVPDDTDVWLFVDSNASIFFNDTDGGTVIGIALDFPPCTSVALYNITTDASDADVWVEIALQLNGHVPTNVTRADSADALYSDVNNDGVVDGTDVSLVAIAVKSTTPGGEYFADFDVNRDEKVNEDDVHTVNENKGATLTALNFWIEGNTLFIENDEWCVFRAR